MKKMIYCVRDELAEVFMDPFTSINDATAKRDFIAGVTESNKKNDLALYAIGEYNDNTALLVPFTAPKRLITGFEVGNVADTIETLSVQTDEASA